jgi:hypothetical protein
MGGVNRDSRAPSATRLLTGGGLLPVVSIGGVSHWNVNVGESGRGYVPRLPWWRRGRTNDSPDHTNAWRTQPTRTRDGARQRINPCGFPAAARGSTR